MKKVTIGLTHYDGPACGMSFVDSVAYIDSNKDVENLQRLQYIRLLSLFPGSSVEDVDSAQAPAHVPAQAQAQEQAPAPEHVRKRKK